MATKQGEAGEQQQPTSEGQGGQQPPEGQQAPPGIQVPKEQAPEPPAAENGQAVPPAEGTRQQAPAKTFTTEDIEKARKDEKDKLYNRLSSMEEELKAMKAEREEREKATKEAEKTAAEEARKKQEEEMSLKELLAQKEQEWENRFQSVQQERQRDQALLEQERKFAVLSDYRSRRMTEEAENILPELLDYVRGNSEEEVEQSVADLRARTEKIMGNMQQAQRDARQQMPGAKVTSPPMGPMEEQGSYETLSADDIQNMDMATYAKRREQLLGAASKNREKGLFG